jgi:uncharacterized RmlC-like cupin family protein
LAGTFLKAASAAFKGSVGRRPPGGLDMVRSPSHIADISCHSRKLAPRQTSARNQSGRRAEPNRSPSPAASSVIYQTIEITHDRERAMTDHHSDASHDHHEHWKHDGVQVIKGDRLDSNTAQTPGMFRQAAINHARVGAQKIWAGTVSIQPNAKTGVHHHGELESVIYVIRGKARMRWGERLEYVAEAGPGDFIYVPPFVPHQEINASPDEPLECVLVRSDNEAVVVNITDVDPVERPEEVYWVDPIHKQPE